MVPLVEEPLATPAPRSLHRIARRDAVRRGTVDRVGPVPPGPGRQGDLPVRDVQDEVELREYRVVAVRLLAARALATPEHEHPEKSAPHPVQPACPNLSAIFSEKEMSRSVETLAKNLI